MAFLIQKLTENRINEEYELWKTPDGWRIGHRILRAN